MSATTIDLRLNPALDLAPYAAEYRERGIVQIPNIFEPETADALADLLAKRMPWRLSIFEDDDHKHYSQSEVAALGKDAVQAKMRGVMERARRANGYCFYSYPMIQAHLRGWDPGHPIHLLTEYLNSANFLDLGRLVASKAQITKAEALATLFAPTHFLARHIDSQTTERRAAYVLNFTREWQPDWGGLLLFLDEKRDVTGGFLPRFNVINIFDVKYEHLVTQVSSFAGAGRYSISGWFRDDPPFKTSA